MSNQYFFNVVRPIICQSTSAAEIIAKMRSNISQKQYAKWLIAKPIYDSITKQIQTLSVETDDPTQQAIITAQVEALTQTQNNINKEITEKDANFMAIYPDWQMIDASGKVIKTIYVPSYSDELLIGRCVTLPGPGVIFRKSAALKLNGRNPKWTFVGDYDFWLRLSRLGELRHRPEVLAQWRHHVNSTSVSKRGLKMAKERIEVVESFITANTISDQLKQMALGNAYYMAARIGYFDNKIPAKMYLIKAFKFRRGWVEEAKLHEMVYILFLPASRIFNPIINIIFDKFGRSNYGT
jgi:hypothetical protein